MDQIIDKNDRKDQLAAVEGNGLSLSSLLTPEKQSNVLSDFGRSFAHTLVQSPLEGVAQLIDGKANGDTQKAVHFMDAPEAAKFGTSSWAAQQAGSGLGAILPVLLIHKGVSGAMSSDYSTKAALAMSENMTALTTRQAFTAGGIKMAEAGLTGMVYSGVFTPVKNEGDFWQQRMNNSVAGGLTFATLTGSTLGLKSLSERTATSLPTVSKALGSEIIAGGLSGIPAGLVAANSESLLNGKGFASAEHQLQAALTFSLTGAGFAYGKGKLAEARPAERSSEAPASFSKAGVDVDGRPLAESQRGPVAGKFENYSAAEMGRARTQTLKDLSEIKALEAGKSVLNQFQDSGLSIAQKYRVLNSLAEVREHFVNQKVNGKIEPDQQGNWIHTQGEFGRVIDAARAGKLSPVQKEDALLASMFADSVKSKANFFTHHMDGALAADHVLSKEFGAGFNRARLDGIVNAVREHQIGPPEFMSMLYGNRIKAALNFKLTPEQESSLASLQKKMAEPLTAERYTTGEGSTALKLTAQEKALLNLTGVKEWYVSEQSNPWNKVSRAVIDGDTMDNYFTPGGIGKITGLGGPESDKWFQTRLVDGGPGQVDRSTNVGSARHSSHDAGKLLTPESKPLAESGTAQTEAAISAAKDKTASWLKSDKGIDPSKTEVPFFNSDLKYPNFGEADAQWWNIHRTAADKRTPEQQGFYDQHRFDGLTTKQQSDFLLAKDIRDRVANELRAAQRLDGQQPKQYEPSTRK